MAKVGISGAVLSVVVLTHRLQGEEKLHLTCFGYCLNNSIGKATGKEFLVF